MTTPIKPSQPGGTGGGTPADGSSSQPPVSGGFPGSDYLYSAVGTVKSSFTGFIWHALNGAEMVVRTIGSILFYPFLNHYEAEISPDKLKNILTCIKDGSDFAAKFTALETSVRVADRNKGDTSSAKKIIEAFAEAEKDEFEKIAAQVIKVQDIDMTAITLTPSSYVLSRIQSGETSIKDFYHVLNFYRMKKVSSKEQFIILEYQVQRAEFLRGEIPHTQKLLLFFADANIESFKKVAECLAEGNEEIKAGNGKSLEEVAKEWIKDDGKFEASKMREALDLKSIKTFVEKLKEGDFYEQAYDLHQFFIRKEAEGDQEVSEERRDFMAKTLLEKLHLTFPHLMRDLCLQMIHVDEENKSIAGLYSEAKKDALWGKPHFSPEKYVLSWVKEKNKFDRNVMINAFLRHEQNVLSKGIVDEDKTPSVRLDLFDRALSRIPRAQLGAFINTFAKALCNKELGKRVIEEFIKFDKTEAGGTNGGVRFIEDLAAGTEPSAQLEAVVKKAEDVVKEDDLIRVFRGHLRTAVAYTQIDQFKAEFSDEKIAFRDKIESFLLLDGLKLYKEKSEDTPIRNPQFKKDQLKSLAEKAPEGFGQLAIHIMKESEQTKNCPEVQKLNRLAQEHEAHPEKVNERNRISHEASWNPLKGTFMPLSEEQRVEAERRAYGQVLAAHFISSKDYQETDMKWLFAGMRSFLAK